MRRLNGLSSRAVIQPVRRSPRKHKTKIGAAPLPTKLCATPNSMHLYKRIDFFCDNQLVISKVHP